MSGTLTNWIKTSDVVILCISLCLLGWLYQFFWLTQSAAAGDADTLLVQVMKRAPEHYSLQHDKILEIEGAKGLSMIEIHQGKARFVHSPCRNKFCILHGWLTTPGDTMACLPNQISMALLSSQNKFDALNY